MKAIGGTSLAGIALSLLLSGGCRAPDAPPPVSEIPKIENAERAILSPEEFAWELFVATNWPALPGSRGVPDPNRPFGPQARAVWETWKASTEVFLAAGATPPGWDAPDPSSPDSAKAGLRLSDGVMLASSAQFSFVSGGLLDVRNLPIYSEVRMNRVAFDQVVGQGLYNVEGQLAYLAANGPLRMPLGAMEVKASWRILDPVLDSAIAHEYFQAQGILENGNGGTQRVTLGLTGMNLMVKVLDDWFWTSFEQEDNAAQTYDREFPSVMLAVRIDERMQAVNAEWRARLAGSPWAHYRSNGAQVTFVNSDSTPTFLSNTQQETRILKTSSCIGCHAYSALGRVGGVPTRLFPLRTAHDDGTGTGYFGTPRPADLRNYRTLDYMWSFIEASPKSPQNATEFLMVDGSSPPKRE
jgi:hypothetical protein